MLKREKKRNYALQCCVILQLTASIGCFRRNSRQKMFLTWFGLAWLDCCRTDLIDLTITKKKQLKQQ